MNKLILFLLLFASSLTFGQGRSYILKPDAHGYLVVNGGYKPGDTLYLSGYFKSVAIYNLSGAASNNIIITNLPGQTLIIGDSTWSGGAWAQALIFRGCHFIEVRGTSKSNFLIVGSNSTKLDGNGYPVRTAYFDLSFTEFSDNIIAHDISIRHGGAGVFAKTEISSTNSSSWYPNTYLNNFEFYNLDIYDTYNEAMYIGHTATYWNIQNNTPYYPAPGIVPNPAVYKQPIKLAGVSIHDNYIHDIGNDGIQTAAIDNLQVYNNEITNWASKKGYADNGGILIGGRVKDFIVHDNYVHDGWGELLQIYAEGGATAIINNNLMLRNKLDGVSIRGTAGLAVAFTNNTIAYVGNNITRFNGYYGGTGQNILKRNILAQPQMNGGAIYPKNYIYLENGGQVIDDDNKKLATWTGAPIAGYGYTKIIPNQPPIADPGPDQAINITFTLIGKGYDPEGGALSFKWEQVSGPSCYIVSPASQNTIVIPTCDGDYVFRLTVTDDKGASASKTATVSIK